MKRYQRVQGKITSDTYNVVLMGNARDYDVAVSNGSGMRNIFQLDPKLGILNYSPDVKSIRNNYSKDHKLG
jgi:hypothetical protein